MLHMQIHPKSIWTLLCPKVIGLVKDFITFQMRRHITWLFIVTRNTRFRLSTFFVT